ncbi:hypothetical protein HKD37_09G024567 [Glycine soja]
MPTCRVAVNLISRPKMSPPATVHQYVSHSKPLQYVSKLLQYVSKAFPIHLLLLSSFRHPKRHFFLPFSLSLISLSPIAISPFFVPSFHFFILPVFLRFFTSKAMIFYTKTVIFISDSMTTISYLHSSPDSMTTIAYLRSSPGLHFYIVFLVEEHTKASASIACREGGRADYNCSFYLKTPRLIFVCVSFLRSVVAMAGNFDRKSTDSGDRVANNQEATKLE